MTLLERITRIFQGDPQVRIVKTYQPIVDQINAFEPAISALTDDQLRAKTDEFRALIKKGKTVDDILPEAFAVVREASKRTLKMRHFDVQLIGGLVLHEGKIAEMKTGEGKTLVATLPAYLNALEGKGVYIVTVNDYLARRDCEWMGKIYTFLGLSIGVIQSGMDPVSRKTAYACDITYGTNNEFGFDYLRDNLAWDISQVSQVRRHYAIVDEVDSILIDEARTPLIISGPIQDSTSKYVQTARVAKLLQKETHFTLDEKHKNAVLTEEGIDKIEKDLNVDNIYSVRNMDLAHMLVQCLKAKYLYKRDVDYVVKDGEVVIVDEFTGRLMEGRRYSDGLHQAIEAVEGLVIREESQTLASITFQNYFRMFPKLAGMTGTAATEAAEFENIYALQVVSIPTHMPMVREDFSDVVYKTKAEKYKAIVSEIKELHKKGQPVLVGTIAIETSELLSTMLRRENITHNVLNAKHHEREAEIIALAGQKAVVTIATNMAGRGTDIVLGDGVKAAGGLFVLGSERHEARRIDNQLRGRSGRQGDPGASRFYVALEDELMRLFGSDKIASMMNRLGMPDDMPIEHPWISKSIERAQTKVERYHFSIRKQVLQYDDVMNKQRETIYALRRQILEGRDLSDKIQEMITDIVKVNAASFYGDEAIKPASTEAFDGFVTKLLTIFPIQNLAEVVKNHAGKPDTVAQLSAGLYQFYLFRKQQYPEGLFDQMITRPVYLEMLDRKWRDHLYNMDILREGIGLRAWGQRDPLMEYKIEGFDMFSEMLQHIAEEALSLMNRATLVENKTAEAVHPHETPMIYNKSDSDGKRSISKPDKVGRNDLCPCGSGRKYKKCCMK